MSAHEHANAASDRANRRAAHSETPVAPPAAAPAAAPLATIPVSKTVEMDINGTKINVPVRFQAGHTLTENQAKVLDAAYQRQFNNNQTALAKSRAESLKAAKTDDERAKYLPKSAAEIEALYVDYEPSIGGIRLSQTERNRLDAGWRAAAEIVSAHNADPSKGILKGAIGKKVPLPTSAKKLVDAEGKPIMDAETGKQKIETLADQRDMYAKRFLALPAFAEVVQKHLDAIMAEKGAAKNADKAPAAEETSLEAAFG